MCIRDRLLLNLWALEGNIPENRKVSGPKFWKIVKFPRMGIKFKNFILLLSNILQKILDPSLNFFIEIYFLICFIVPPLTTKMLNIFTFSRLSSFRLDLKRVFSKIKHKLNINLFLSNFGEKRKTYLRKLVLKK